MLTDRSQGNKCGNECNSLPIILGAHRLSKKLAAISGDWVQER